ncbi:O-antigen ligase family protein [Microterricola viridarii]|uniref:O-antigen ligase like membrane protein n=1 Tax=Microterricola viridarii TaxID=412690 RepID=A0A109QX90_9MICO|nr:O-antigen ligase family protein [Microterricola viridarii]AMB59583.1 hypothetical protein AWU67_12695 [Microterricola viridarii]
MIFVTILFVAGVFAVLRTRARVSGYVAAVCALVLAVLVPSNTPPTSVVALATLASLLLLAIGSFRALPFIDFRRTNPWLILFISYVTVRSLVETDWPYGLVILSSGAGLSLLAVLAGQSWVDRRGRPLDLLLTAIPAVIVLQFLLAVAEVSFRAEAIWPMSVGWDHIESRVNTIAPWLVGRAMGSTGHPIPLGVLAAVGIVVCIWLFVERRLYWALAVAAVAGTLIVFSGTRSALIAAVLALVYFLATKLRLKTLLIGGAVAVAVSIAVYYSGLLENLGLGTVKETDSFTHRAGVLQLLPELVQRGSVLETLFGTGYGSIAEALQRFAVGVDGIDVFDQEFLRTGWATGLVGLGLLAAAVIVGWLRNDVLGRMLLIVMLVMFASWDALSWNLGFVLLVVVAARRRPLDPQAPGEVDIRTKRGRRALGRQPAQSSGDAPLSDQDELARGSAHAAPSAVPHELS